MYLWNSFIAFYYIGSIMFCGGSIFVDFVGTSSHEFQTTMKSTIYMMFQITETISLKLYPNETVKYWQSMDPPPSPPNLNVYLVFNRND